MMIWRGIDWERAINSRRSIRSFEQRAVEAETMERLVGFVAELEAPFSHDVQIRFFKGDPRRRLYISQNTPPDNAAFITSTDIASIAKAGFVGELFILYAVSLGLATCWFGHYTLSELERELPHLGDHASLPMPRFGYGRGVVPGKRAICITPLGYWQKEGLRLQDRITERIFSYRRKPVGVFLEAGMAEQDLPPQLLYAFDLARKAPSGANSQHWRFHVSPDFKSVTIAMPVGYKHIKWEHPDVDIGICAGHFWLGLLLQDVTCGVSVDEEEGRAVWRFTLP